MNFNIAADSVFKGPWDNAKLEKDIMTVPGALPREVCDRIISIAESNSSWFQRSRTVSEVDGKLEDSPRQSDSMYLTAIAQDYQFMKQIDDLLFFVFSSGLRAYTQLVGHDVSVNSDEGYTLLRYRQGDYYKYHTDNGGASTRTLRTMSALIYLNDNYEGGEIDFPRQEVKIKPTAGMLVMFPAILTFPHASLPVKSGTKYTVVTWFR